MNFLKKKKKMGHNKHESKDLIKDLSVMLNDYGDKILSEEVTFSLNASSLTCINDGLSQISTEDRNVTFDVVQTNNSKLTFLHDLHFIYDFIQKIPAIKLNHGNSTLQGRFNICKLRSLKSLEIKKIPIHLVIGLQYLRPKLETIICSRSVQSLEDLFGKCGGDLSQPYTWCELKHVNLSYNGIETIDDSLKLLPYLEILNLSHNNIKQANNLESLTVIKHLSLSYNCLNICPMLSSSSRGTLLYLNLCYNNLESLDGIDEFYALEELDVSGNCLISHSVLKKVMLLKNLKSLNLSENPISYHKCHRKFSIKYLHPDTAKSKFSLDGKYLSHEEEIFVRETQVFSISNRVSNGRICAEIDEDGERPSTSHPSLNTSVYSVERSFTDIEASLEYSSSPMQRRKKKSSKITDAVIIDPNELDLVKSAPSVEEVSQVPEAHLEIKSKVKNAREKFGQDWLIASRQNIGLPARNDSFGSVDAIASSFQDDENDGIIGLKNMNVNRMEPLENLSQTKAAGEDAPTKDQSSNQSSNMYDNGKEHNDKDSSSEDSYVIDDAAFYVVNTENDEDVSPCIISIGSRYIVEKDSMTGKVFDELDLHSLVRYDQVNQGEESFSLLLIFDYIKKSRRERTYHFENGDQLDSFRKHLEPYIMKRNLKALSKGALQCLKCGAQFYKEGAASKIKTVDRITTEQSSYPSSYNGNEGYLVEVPACPNCESDMVVEMDPSSDVAVPKRKASTPLSSSAPKVTFDGSFKADEKANKHGDPLINTLVRRISDENVPKIVNNDAVIYSSQNSFKNEIEVEAEVYNLQTGIDHLDMSADAHMNTDDLFLHREIARTDSDVSILSNPSQSSIAILSSQNGPNDYEAVDNSASRTSSPESASTIMEKSVYDDSSDQSNTQHNIDCNTVKVENSENANSVDVDTDVGSHSPDLTHSFTDVDYRIKLHLSITLFGKDEDFRGLLKAGIVPYQKLKEYEGCVVLSNNSIYILKVIGQADLENPQNYLQKVDCKNLSQLKCVNILCGRQGFQLDFVLKGKSTVYTILVRDSEKCSDFMGLFVGVMESWSKALSLEVPLVHMATKNTMQRIKEEIFDIEEGEIVREQENVEVYIMGWWKENNANMVPVSFVFTSSCIYVAEDNFEWPLPWSLTNSESPKSGQFNLLSQKKIMSLSEIKCDIEKNDTEAVLDFSEEDSKSSGDVQWHIRMDSIFSLGIFIEAVRTPWEQLFGVELNMSSRIE